MSAGSRPPPNQRPIFAANVDTTLNVRKKRFTKSRSLIFLAVSLVAIVFFLVLPNITNVTGTAPLLELPLLLRKGGQIVPHNEVRVIRYRFDESLTTWEPMKEHKDIKEAKPLGDDFRLYAPFTIRTSAGKKTIAPKYQSLWVQVELANETSLPMSLPVISEKALGGPIQIDLDSSKR